MRYASEAYAKTAKQVSDPRKLEAELLLKAAARLQAVRDTWSDEPKGLGEALHYNRRLWTVFLDAVLKDDNRLPVDVRENIANIGMFIMGETFSLMTKPKPEHLTPIININRSIAAGLRGKN